MAPKRKREVWQRPTSKESSFTDCPACQMKVVSYLINHHLDWDCRALVKNKEQSLIAEAAETTGVLSKNPERISSEAKHHDGDVQDFEVRVEDRLPVNNKAEAEFSDHQRIHNLDAEGQESLIFVPPETHFQYWHIHSPEKKPQDESPEISVAFKFNAHSFNELGFKIHGGQPDASPKLQSNTNLHCMKGGKQFCTVFPTTSIGSEAELKDDNFGRILEVKEHISSCCEDVMLGKLDSGRMQSSAEASTLSPKNAKNDVWGFITASLPSKVPKGHYVFENFISEKEEQELVSFLDMDIKNPWKVVTFNGSYLGKGYGLSTDLRKRRICPASFEMPKILVPVFERMRTTVPALMDFWPNETNAIAYCKDKGHWLKPHVDDRQLSGTILVNLSLCGDCKMTYERERGPRESYKVLLRRRCIQIQTGECRYNFTHSILNEDLLAPRRVSMTFRQSLSL